MEDAGEDEEEEDAALEDVKDLYDDEDEEGGTSKKRKRSATDDGDNEKAGKKKVITTCKLRKLMIRNHLLYHRRSGRRRRRNRMVLQNRNARNQVQNQRNNNISRRSVCLCQLYLFNRLNHQRRNLQKTKRKHYTITGRRRLCISDTEFKRPCLIKLGKNLTWRYPFFSAIFNNRNYLALSKT